MAKGNHMKTKILGLLTVGLLAVTCRLSSVHFKLGEWPSPDGLMKLSS